jgi:hypothetical protein
MGVVGGGGILHGGELKSSEIPFGDITAFCKGSGDVLLSFMSSSKRTSSRNAMHV